MIHLLQRLLANLAMRIELFSARLGRRVALATEDQTARKLALARSGGALCVMVQHDSGGPVHLVTSIGQPIPANVQFESIAESFPTRGYRLSPQMARELGNDLVDAADMIEFGYTR